MPIKNTPNAKPDEHQELGYFHANCMLQIKVIKQPVKDIAIQINRDNILCCIMYYKLTWQDLVLVDLMHKMVPQLPNCVRTSLICSQSKIYPCE